MLLDEAVSAVFVRDEPELADLALVFGHCDADVSHRRARHAVSLYRQGLVPRLLFSGGGHTTADGTPEAERMASEALGLGVPAEVVLLELRSRNTYENVENSLALLREMGLLSGVSVVLLVSWPWHTRRVLLLARHVFPSEIRLLCAPHQESCTERTWSHSVDCRRFVRDELRLLARLTGIR
ncbi:MAG TPA: YdcF family protein [Gemmataceae bacterium]|nr:YdcF family protein [Gemmataceae bacterium]